MTWGPSCHWHVLSQGFPEAKFQEALGSGIQPPPTHLFLPWLWDGTELGTRGGHSSMAGSSGHRSTSRQPLLVWSCCNGWDETQASSVAFLFSPMLAPVQLKALL